MVVDSENNENDSWLSLKPFERDVSGVNVQAKLTRKSSLLVVQFQVFGPELSRVSMPLVSRVPAPTPRLWEKTCFEVFLRPNQANAYTEWNLAPSKDWYCMNFSQYRQLAGIDTTNPKISIENGDEDFRLTATLKSPQDRNVAVGVSCVLCHESGSISHWAIRHPDATKPDFHHPESFALGY